MTNTARSYVEYYGAQQQKCGYCKKNDSSSTTHSMWAHCLTAADYQALIDRGWRRSGKYCYKPSMSTTCCPSYTIRCDASAFKISKSQKKVIKRMNRYLSNGLPDKRDDNIDGADRSSPVVVECAADPDPMMALSGRGADRMDVSEQIERLRAANVVEAKPTVSKDVVPEEKLADKPTSVIVATAVETSQPNKPLQKKAKLMRLERRQAKLNQSTVANPATTERSAPRNPEKSLAMLLAEGTDQGKHKLQLKLLKSCDSMAETPELLQLYQKYQMTVHGDMRSDVDGKSFTRFLVDSPIEHEIAAGGPATGYGTFHQQYWLDDRLIAVAVLDILPRCVSAVYFFYDPEFRDLSLGTYSSFRELGLVQTLHATAPSIEFYYMGYYIHSCPKMRYKAHMKPSALLCPEVFSWHLLNDAIVSKLDLEPYQRLDDDLDALDVDTYRTRINGQNVVLLTNNKLLTFKQLQLIKPPSRVVCESIDEYGELVGGQLSQRLVFIL